MKHISPIGKIIVFINIVMFIIISMFSCQHDKSIETLVDDWLGKDIIFPKYLTFTKYGKDTIDYEIPKSDYKVLIYVDSVGCTSCKLQLSKWQEWISYINKASTYSISYVFFFQPQSAEEIIDLLEYNHFDNPICIDTKGEVNRLNHFPKDGSILTFLLDANDKVILIGNPINNEKIKELYQQVLINTSSVQNQQRQLTSVSIPTNEINLDEIEIGNIEATFTLTNTGNSNLIINTVHTSCTCTSPVYDKRPISPSTTTSLKIKVKPKQKGYFHETITVYCNSQNSPIYLTLKGNAI